jgi:hypothetical protein
VIPVPATSPEAPPARAGLGPAVVAELSKLRLQRPTWLLAGIVYLLLGLVLFAFTQDPLVASDLGHRPLAALEQMLPAVQFAFTAGVGLVMLTTGSRLVGIEYSLGTIRIIVGRGTGRAQLVLAQLLATLLVGLALLVGYSLLTSAGLGLVTLHLTGSLAPMGKPPVAGWRDLGLGVASCAISTTACAAVGVGLAAATRSLTAAMVLSILFFPLDNALALAFRGLFQLDRLHLWQVLSAALLGPTLNRLPQALVGHGGTVSQALPQPLLQLPQMAALGVVAAWTVGLVLLAVLISVRGDILA